MAFEHSAAMQSKDAALAAMQVPQHAAPPTSDKHLCVLKITELADKCAVNGLHQQVQFLHDEQITT